MMRRASTRIRVQLVQCPKCTFQSFPLEMKLHKQEHQVEENCKKKRSSNAARRAVKVAEKAKNPCKDLKKDKITSKVLKKFKNAVKVPKKEEVPRKIPAAKSASSSKMPDNGQIENGRYNLRGHPRTVPPPAQMEEDPQIFSELNDQRAPMNIGKDQELERQQVVYEEEIKNLKTHFKLQSEATHKETERLIKKCEKLESKLTISTSSNLKEVEAAKSLRVQLSEYEAKISALKERLKSSKAKKTQLKNKNGEMIAEKEKLTAERNTLSQKYVLARQLCEIHQKKITELYTLIETREREYDEVRDAFNIGKQKANFIVTKYNELQEFVKTQGLKRNVKFAAAPETGN